MDERIEREPNEHEPEHSGLERLRDDAARLWKFAVKFGALLALACHLLPHHYRPICDAVASLCTRGR